MSTKKPLPQPEREEIRIEDVLQAMGEPVRLQIVRILAELPDGIACGEIDLQVTPSTRAHHLRILREAGVISTHTDGTKRISSLRREDLEHLYPGLVPGVLAAPR